MTSKIVDLLALQGLREELEAIAEEHPRLIDPSATGPANVDSWEGIVDKPKLKAVSFRLPADLIEDRVDGYASKVQRHTGVKVSRTDAVRVLLELSLDLVDLVEADDRLPPDPAVIRELTTMALEAVQRIREPVA